MRHYNPKANPEGAMCSSSSPKKYLLGVSGGILSKWQMKWFSAPGMKSFHWVLETFSNLKVSEFSETSLLASGAYACMHQ